MEKNKINPNVLLLEDIYKSVSLDADTLTAIIGKTEDDGQKSILSAMLDTYEGFANQAKKRYNGGIKRKELTHEASSSDM